MQCVKTKIVIVSIGILWFQFWYTIQNVTSKQSFKTLFSSVSSAMENYKILAGKIIIVKRAYEKRLGTSLPCEIIAHSREIPLRDHPASEATWAGGSGDKALGTRLQARRVLARSHWIQVNSKLSSSWLFELFLIPVFTFWYCPNASWH